MRQIIKILPKERQTMLFSATQTTKVGDLVTLEPYAMAAVSDTLPL